MAAARFDAVFLDFYGTISAGDREAVTAACRRLVSAFNLRQTAEELAVAWGERFFALIGRSNHESFKTLLECECTSLNETLSPIVGEFDPTPFVEGLERYWRAPPLHADAAEALRRLRLPVCCVSNADERPLADAIARHGLRFDAVVSSESARCYKPDEGIFRRAAETLAVDPARVLHVGDSLHSDVSGAAKLGITTVWLRRPDRIHDIGSARPHHTISSLSELPRIVA
jgi:2-haloalkanoic acid dehalogenase type II